MPNSKYILPNSMVNYRHWGKRGKVQSAVQMACTAQWEVLRTVSSIYFYLRQMPRLP